MPVSALDGQVQEEQREGYDVATIHYTDGEGNERAIPLTETASGYADTLPEGVTEEQVMVEYFSTTRWDGAVDLSWYNGTDTEFTITTARQLAGVAALVNSNAAWGRTSPCCGMRRRASRVGLPGPPSRRNPLRPIPRHRRQQQCDRPVGCVGCGWRGHYRAGGAACH